MKHQMPLQRTDEEGDAVSLRQDVERVISVLKANTIAHRLCRGNVQL